jgi:transposase
VAPQYVVEHLNHLGIVAEVCREIGVGEWLDQQEPGNRQRVSVATATVALVLNGLGFSNRRLYLVSQFFADKPVEHLLGPGITADDLNDDCLGRTLDWLYAHAVTRLFAGLALRARRAFGVEVGRLHADTTSFAVHGRSALDLPVALETAEALKAAAQASNASVEDRADAGMDEGAPAVIAVTYGYSRDHREDLKHWRLALVTSGEGVPQFLRPLDGNASAKRALLDAVSTVTPQLQQSDEPPGVYVADSGLYSAENMTRSIRRACSGSAGCPRRPHPPRPSYRNGCCSTRRMTAGTAAPMGCATGGAGSRPTCPKAANAGWWCAPATAKSARATLQRQADREQATWEKRLWHLGNQTFACQPDAEAALAKACQRLPPWLQVQSRVSSHLTYSTRGRPRKVAPVPATPVWQIQATLSRDAAALEREAVRRAAYIIGTNLLDLERWPNEAVIELYREQSVVERGFAFLKDPLFLASSVFVKRPERIMALAFIMTLCQLVYKLAERRVRQRLAATGHTVPDQVRKPTARRTLRWLFQCFEGVDLLHISAADGSHATEILRLDPLHRRVLHLMEPANENCYLALQQTAE